MNTTEALSVHKALHNRDVEYVRTSYDKVSDDFLNKARRIRHARSSTQELRSINVGPYFVATQNMRKPSPNTDWVRTDPEHRKLTWIMKSGTYVGQIREFIDEDGKRRIEVRKLNPERLVYSWVEGGEGNPPS